MSFRSMQVNTSRYETTYDGYTITRDMEKADEGMAMLETAK